jgi:aminoglycoside phosphotransferase (APT) family kinase protein
MTRTRPHASPAYGFDDDEPTRRLLRSRPPTDALRWVAAVLGTTVVSASALRGGLSSAVHALRVIRPDGDVGRVVLRRYVRQAVVDDEPDIAAREAHVLGFVEQVSLPIPRLLAVDPTGADSGSPALLMSFLPGRVVWSPRDLDVWLWRLAEILPHIHATLLAGPGELRTYVPYPQRSYEPPEWALDPALWARAVEIFHDPPPRNEVVFVHRDFHPGNVLWRYGKVSGVIDWQAACTGPPSVDVGHCRFNLLTYGAEVADRFTHRWESVTGRSYHPWADVATIIGCLDDLRACPPADPSALERFLARSTAAYR